MSKTKLTIAEQVAQVASDFQKRQTGHAPSSVTVVLTGETLVITLHGALTPAEQAVALDPTGAEQVQEFHRRLFANSSDALRETIARITGVAVREAAAEVEPASGAVVHAFTSGTMVQVFQMGPNPSAGDRDGSASESAP